jgi:WhiB family redox-sensing transcriptional regulator
VFFDPEPEAEQAAKAICARCDVSSQCAAWAVEQRMSHGVFGGLNPMERRQLTLAAAEALSS